MCKAIHRLVLLHTGNFRIPRSVAVGIFALLIPFASSSAADDHDDLKEEVHRLQQENADLQKRLDSQAQSVDKVMQRLESLEQKSSAPQTNVPETAAVETGKNTNPFTVPSLNLQWFGDVDFRTGGKVKNGEAQPNTFSLGQLGLMAHSHLTENVSVLSEIVFQYKDDESSSTTIERLFLQYQLSDLVNFRLGRTHTPFGYWNETFHHGTWFQTTTLRPEIMRFHDGGSVLPIHSVGLEMYGYQSMNLLDVYYDTGVANGRGKKYTDTVDVQDQNGNKAVYGVFSLAPAAVPGLRFGANVYKDVIPPDASTPARNGDIDELISGAHVVYIRNHLELLSEAMWIQHDDAVSSRRFTTWGMYAQVGYELGAFKPYYRFDRLDVAEGDPYYGPQVVDETRNTLGLRWDFIDRAALKFEYQHIHQDNLSSPHAFYVQAAFTF